MHYTIIAKFNGKNYLLVEYGDIPHIFTYPSVDFPFY